MQIQNSINAVFCSMLQHRLAPEAVPYPSEPYPWIELLQLGTKGLLALGQWQDMASSHAVCEICTPKRSMMYMN